MSVRIKPLQVCGRDLEEVREKDPDSRIVVHHRTVDTLGKMLRAGTISQAMHDTARAFQAAFVVANLDPIRAMPLLRMPGAGHEPCLNERQVDARRRVHAALQALEGSTARPAAVSGTSWACGARSGSGRSGRAGTGGRCARSRHRGF